MDDKQVSKLMEVFDARFCVLLDALAAIKNEVIKLTDEVRRFRSEFEDRK
jgi:hypothetical protein